MIRFIWLVGVLPCFLLLYPIVGESAGKGSFCNVSPNNPVETSTTFQSSAAEACIAEFRGKQLFVAGEPMAALSAGMYYHLTGPSEWSRILEAAEFAGFNTITTYILWSQIELYPSILDFKQLRKLQEFIKFVKDKQFFVILNVGPYICDHFINGGLPLWLYNIKELEVHNPSNSKWRYYTRRWLSILISILQYEFTLHGGPILGIQAEPCGCEHNILNGHNDMHIFNPQNEMSAFSFNNSEGENSSYLDTQCRASVKNLQLPSEFTRKAYSSKSEYLSGSPLLMRKHTLWLTAMLYSLTSHVKSLIFVCTNEIEDMELVFNQRSQRIAMACLGRNCGEWMRKRCSLTEYPCVWAEMWDTLNQMSSSNSQIGNLLVEILDYFINGGTMLNSIPFYMDAALMGTVSRAPQGDAPLTAFQLNRFAYADPFKLKKLQSFFDILLRIASSSLKAYHFYHPFFYSPNSMEFVPHDPFVDKEDSHTVIQSLVENSFITPSKTLFKYLQGEKLLPQPLPLTRDVVFSHQYSNVYRATKPNAWLHIFNDLAILLERKDTPYRSLTKHPIASKRGVIFNRNTKELLFNTSDFITSPGMDSPEILYQTINPIVVSFSQKTLPLYLGVNETLFSFERDTGELLPFMICEEPLDAYQNSTVLQLFFQIGGILEFPTIQDAKPLFQCGEFHTQPSVLKAMDTNKKYVKQMAKPKHSAVWYVFDSALLSNSMSNQLQEFRKMHQSTQNYKLILKISFVIKDPDLYGLTLMNKKTILNYVQLPILLFLDGRFIDTSSIQPLVHTKSSYASFPLYHPMAFIRLICISKLSLLPPYLKKLCNRITTFMHFSFIYEIPLSNEIGHTFQHIAIHRDYRMGTNSLLPVSLISINSKFPYLESQAIQDIYTNVLLSASKDKDTAAGVERSSSIFFPLELHGWLHALMNDLSVEGNSTFGNFDKFGAHSSRESTSSLCDYCSIPYETFCTSAASKLDSLLEFPIWYNFTFFVADAIDFQNSEFFAVSLSFLKEESNKSMETAAFTSEMFINNKHAGRFSLEREKIQTPTQPNHTVRIPSDWILKGRNNTVLLFVEVGTPYTIPNILLIQGSTAAETIQPDVELPTKTYTAPVVFQVEVQLKDSSVSKVLKLTVGLVVFIVLLAVLIVGIDYLRRKLITTSFAQPSAP